MAEQPKGRYLMHLIRLDGSSLFLHPFTEQVSMIEVFAEGIPQGLSAANPLWNESACSERTCIQ